MEEKMHEVGQDTTFSAPRRSLFGRLAGSVAIGLACLTSTAARAATDATESVGPDWPGKLKGRHRQVVDAYEANSGSPLAFAYTFLATNESATAVIVLRHGAFP